MSKLRPNFLIICVRTNGIPRDPSIPTVPGALAEAGYHTASIGKIHLSIFGYGQPWDEMYSSQEFVTPVTPNYKITTYTGHRGPRPYGELFDLVDDPYELHNLWDSPTHTPLCRELIEQLHHRLTETDIALPRRLGHA